MPVLLHILNRPADTLVEEILAAQRDDPLNTVVVIDLTQPDADFDRLVDQVFAADSVASW
ncbi:MAG: hypothetical protein EXS36_08030 [Pedosphaera sp.]|nr:hypothetical protein [Pedosphaera sp.]